MRLLSLLAVLFALLVALPAEAASLFDPAIRWKTIVTPHFRVNFPEGYEDVAKRAAGYAEEAHQLLSPYLDEVPERRTELNLMDNQDMANGFGFPLPNNQIFIYLTSSSEDHFSGRYDSYLRDLLIHEYTHVLHLEKTAGLPAWINGFFGRSYFPNMFQPIFLIEGLAVTTETRFSHGGRGRDSIYRAYLRVAALEEKLVGIDKASGYNTVDHPGGEIPYVYGTAFYRFLTERYGEAAPAAIADRYAHYPFFGLYGVDETLKAVTGKDAGTLWAEMQTWLTVRATVEREAILAQGPLTRLTPVTTGGMHHRRPVYRPDGTLVYAGWDGHGYSYLYQAGGQAPKAIISKGPFGRYTYSADGRYIYHTRNWDDNRFTGYDDLFRWDTKERKIDRLSERERLSEPAVSPDGRWVVAVKNEKGQNNLIKMRADGTDKRALTALSDHTQLGGPAWHPTRHTIAVSAWRDGSRDLYLVDPESGRMKPFWKDRDVELSPTFSPDGRYMIYSSDATGVFNLYAYELETGKLFRMTNVLGGLF
ncbi:MAG: TolB family protein, partial [Candidatus Sericytochromatia bacterium]